METNSGCLYQDLVSDLELICEELISSYGLKYTKKEQKLANPIMRWMDFVSRYITNSPRQLLVSKQLQEKISNSNFPKKVIRDFNSFANRALCGCDINPFQSKGLIEHNDTSSSKKSNRTDLLFADWGILHFHLSDEVKSHEYFAVRSDWLLFAVVYNDTIFCIDVLPHSKKQVFSRKELLEILYRNWPFLLEPYEMKGISSGYNWSDLEVSELRKAGVSTTYTIDGKVFMPAGLGLTTAAIPLKNIEMVQKVMYGIECVVDLVADPNSNMTLLDLPQPKLGFSLVPSKGLVLYDSNNDIAYVLPRTESRKDALSLLHELIVPTWLVLEEKREQTKSKDM